VGQILEKYDKYKVVIEGHADEMGDDIKNLRLSEDRAETVWDYLVDTGIKKGRLTFRGLGDTAPIYSEINPERNKINKRIDFFLYR
jgi:outer membrane protein OmpA-like peptidoglycan-associated protein